jgi:hypothetical protein
MESEALVFHSKLKYLGEREECSHLSFQLKFHNLGKEKKEQRKERWLLHSTEEQV